MQLRDTKPFSYGGAPGASGLPASVVEACARAAHEAERAFCEAIDDEVRRPWSELTERQRESARAAADVMLAGVTDEMQHAEWCDALAKRGWSYGPVEDSDQKRHPHLVPYAELSEIRRKKSDLCWAVVQATALVLKSAIKVVV